MGLKGQENWNQALEKAVGLGTIFFMYSASRWADNEFLAMDELHHLKGEQLLMKEIPRDTFWK